MGELDFENVVFGYGGNALFNDFPHLSRKSRSAASLDRTGAENQRSPNSPWGL